MRERDVVLELAPLALIDAGAPDRRFDLPRTTPAPGRAAQPAGTCLRAETENWCEPSGSQSDRNRVLHAGKADTSTGPVGERPTAHLQLALWMHRHVALCALQTFTPDATSADCAGLRRDKARAFELVRTKVGRRVLCVDPTSVQRVERASRKS